MTEMSVVAAECAEDLRDTRLQEMTPDQALRFDARVRRIKALVESIEFDWRQAPAEWNLAKKDPEAPR